MAAKFKPVPAETEDAEAIAALRNAVADELTFQHGKGPWTQHHTTAAVLQDLRSAKLYVILRRDEVVASFKLSSPKSSDAKHGPASAASANRLLLSKLCVAPEYRRRGYGRACIEAAIRAAKRAKASGVVAATYALQGGKSAAFYTQCGFTDSLVTASSAQDRHFYTLEF